LVGAVLVVLTVLVREQVDQAAAQVLLLLHQG
jgi:hypothetical protein